VERKRSRSRVKLPGASRYGVLGFLVVMSALDGACGRTDVWYRDDAYGAQGGSHLIGGTGGKAGSGTGKGGTGSGAVSTGGTSVTGGTGGSFGTGGSVGIGGTFGAGGSNGGGSGRGGSPGFGGRSAGGRGGAGNAGRSGAAGTAGAGATGPFACPGTLPTCDRYTNFALTNDITWGSGAFTGGIAVFGSGIYRVGDTSQIHVAGSVDGYGNGFVIWFTTCSDLRNATGVFFTATGTTDFMDQVQFSPMVNSDYPWQSAPENGKGACTSSNPSDPWGDCVLPYRNVLLSTQPQSIYWTSVVGGAPVAWNANTSPGELIGLQWLFPYDANVGAYDIDVTLDNVGFIDANPSAVDCGYTLGAGGAGGMGGAAGFGGTAGFGGVPVAGATSSGGVSFGGASNAGFGGLGGASGIGGLSGFGGASGFGGFAGTTQTGGIGGLAGQSGSSAGSVAAGAAGL